MTRRRVLFLQYTNPAAYPPLIHAAELFEEAGWTVHILGVKVGGNSDSVDWPASSHATVRWLRRPSTRVGRGIHYLLFCAFATWVAIRERMSWVYASDAMATPPALLLKMLGRKIVYHEHDAPSAHSRFFAPFRAARRRLFRTADAVVVPSERRLALLPGVRNKPSFVVWNCPSRRELLPDKQGNDFTGPIRLYYHGNISPNRIPTTILSALRDLPNDVTLRVVGYATNGNEAYWTEFSGEARRMGIAERIELLDAVPRSQLWGMMRHCHVGLALLPSQSNDPNLSSMAGASNKCFDYMAAGLIPLVPDTEDFRPLVEQGYACSCSAADGAAISRLIQMIRSQPESFRARSRSAMEKIASDWNYDRLFAPVLQYIESVT